VLVHCKILSTYSIENENDPSNKISTPALSPKLEAGASATNSEIDNVITKILQERKQLFPIT